MEHFASLTFLFHSLNSKLQQNIQPSPTGFNLLCQFCCYERNQTFRSHLDSNRTKSIMQHSISLFSQQTNWYRRKVRQYCIFELCDFISRESVFFMIIYTLISLISGHLCIYLSHQKNWGQIRASAFLSLFFYFLNIYFFKIELASEIFFAASFVGMSNYNRLNHYWINISLILLPHFSFYIFSFQLGLGGSLGFSAFVSSLTAILIKYLLESKFKVFKVN